MPDIILCSLNAKYIHASLGLRYLLANMSDLRAQTALCEFTIARRPQELADELLALLGEPTPGRTQMVGFGVYIWNVTRTCEVVCLLKGQRHNLKIVLGGPEVSHEVDGQTIVQQTGAVSVDDMQRFTRLARYRDLVVNSGRFGRTLALLLGGQGAGPSPFGAFLRFADWLWQSTGKTSGLTPEALVDALFDYLTAVQQLPAGDVREALFADYLQSGARANPAALRPLLKQRAAPVQRQVTHALASRQARHAPEL